MNGFATGFPAPGRTLELYRGPLTMDDIDDVNLNGIVSVLELGVSNAERIARRLENSVDYTAKGQAEPAPNKLSIREAAHVVAQLPDAKLAELFVREIAPDGNLDRHAVFASALFKAMGEAAPGRFANIAKLTAPLAASSPAAEQALARWKQGAPHESVPGT